MNFSEELLKKQKYVEEVLIRYLPLQEGYQSTVAEAMHYSVMAGGKRIRPILMGATFQVLDGTLPELCEPFMAALEMIHTYSLVHDDLPAMDDDEYRRGRKTTHVVYGEAFAILAGDGLLNLAFETATRAFDTVEGMGGLSDTARLEMMRRVSGAIKLLGLKAGINGMIGGQTADLLAEGRKAGDGEELLSFIHIHKTAALIQCAMAIGGILAGGKPETIKALEEAALLIGLAFQIRDDILDVTGTFGELGKLIGSDGKNEKLTYVSLKGLEAAEAEALRLSHEAMDILESLTGEKDFLLWLVRELISRNH